MAFFFVLLSAGFGKLAAHPTDSLPLPPIMDIITGDFARPSEAYFKWAAGFYGPTKDIKFKDVPEAIEYFRGLAGQGQLKDASEAYEIIWVGQAIEEPGTGHYWCQDELIWHDARFHYLLGEYTAAGDIMEHHGKAGEYKDSLLTEHHYLALFYRYLQENDQRDNKTAPIYPEENRKYGAYLRDFLGWTIDYKGQQSDVALALRALMNVVRYTEGPVPVTAWEGMGDLLLCLPEIPEAKYMASFAYERAAVYASDTLVRDQWRDKALFCLESRAEAAKTYNPRRFYNLEKVINDEFDAASERTAAYEAKEAEAIAAGTNPLEFYSEEALPWKNPESNNIIDFWPNREEYDPLDMVNSELLVEGSKIGADPNADPRNKKLDPKMVKRDVSYNLYALLVFTVLFSVIGVMVWRFRKAAREKKG